MIKIMFDNLKVAECVQILNVDKVEGGALKNAR